MSRRTVPPPSGYEDHLSRKQAAALLGFTSAFPIRQFEKAGRLHAVRGPLGTAFYPRAQVMALRALVNPSPVRSLPRRDPSDANLLAFLREKPRSIVDLVIETGISIARAERTFHFWRANEITAGRQESAAAKPIPRREPPAATNLATNPAPIAATDAELENEYSERRGPARLEHDALVQSLRDPNPKVRAAAFEKLKKNQPKLG